MQEVKVTCRSEDSYPQLPVRLVWDEEIMQVTTILSRSRLPDGLVFRVKTNGDRIFKLYYQEEKDLWSGQEE